MMNLKINIHKIFWGLIIVMINIYIGQFDILADFIGYFLVASGLGKTATFTKARSAAILLGILSIPMLFQPHPAPFTELPANNLTLFMLLSIIGMGLLHFLLIYWMLQGMIKICNKLEATQLAKSAHARLIFYMIGTFLTLLALPFALNAGHFEGTVMIGACAVIMFFTELIILLFLRRFRRELHKSTGLIEAEASS